MKIPYSYVIYANLLENRSNVWPELWFDPRLLELDYSSSRGLTGSNGGTDILYAKPDLPFLGPPVNHS